MGVHDLDARFRAVAADEGTIAAAAIEAIHQAAATVNGLVGGEPYQLSIVIQALETAAHQARTYLNFPPTTQPGEPEGPTDPPAADDDYSAMTVGELRTAIANRNHGRDVDAQIPVSGTKPELVERLEADDRR